jgi:hypothetical protein
MSLSKKQQDFARHVADLIHQIYARGYACTFGHAYRCQDCPIGMTDSVHKSRLAVDLNLFKDGEYLTDTEDYRQFGMYWEALGEHNRWGGAWDDGNHFSYEHQGRK